MAYVETWDETKPAGTRDANLGDDDIREFKRALTERFRAGGMEFPTTDNANAGLYNSLKFIEQSSNPTSEANRGFLFTKDVSSVTELYWMDSAGTATQLTSGGKLLISSLIIASEARGDLIARGASAWGRVAVGASGRFLRSDGTDPAWSLIQAGDITASMLPAGSIVQFVNTTSSGYNSGTGTIPDDDSVPQNTEGNEFMTRAITPNSTTNKLIIVIQAELDSATGVNIIGGLFQDSTANALAAGRIVTDNSAGGPQRMVLIHVMDAGTTSSTTFKFRAGLASAGTLGFNGRSSRLLGGIAASSIMILEVKV